MPLSEHEQRQLDQIERALYAEDPKFASTVRGGRLHRPSRRRRVEGIAVGVLGLALLIVGMVVPVKPGGIPVISLVGFLVMFAGAVIILFAARRSNTVDKDKDGGSKDKGADDRGRGGFAQRMEHRFRRRFEQ